MISNKCFYALKAVLELSLRDGAGPVTIADIAQAQNVPARFLEAILRQLKQNGLVDSLRGKEGGYFLARPARSISVGEILNIFEGPVIAVSVQADSSGERASPRVDVFAEIWTRAEKALDDVLGGVTFSELTEKERIRSGTHAGNYAI
jgi:Rrf2 family protein